MTPAQVDRSIAARFRGGIDIRASKSLQRLRVHIGVCLPELAEYARTYARFVLSGPNL